MSKKARSALGELVDFDLLAIKQQLATTPVPVGVGQRRQFIDEKDGIRTKQVMAAVEVPMEAPVEAVVEAPKAEALSMSLQAVEQSMAADQKQKTKK